jgi:type I restriction enzyme, R subunit
MTTALVVSPAERAVQDEVVEILMGLGWQAMAPDQMTALRDGRMGEAIVEPLLVAAIERINDVTREEAEHVASLVRRITSDQAFIRALRDGLNVKLAPDQNARDIRLIDLDDETNNSFVVTSEFSVRTGGVREPRLDVVCLVNGLALGLIENKGPDHDVAEAAGDWSRYWSDAPQLAVLAAVVACNNGIRYRVGPSGVDAIQQYAEWKDTWPNPRPDDPDEMTVGLVGTLTPRTLIDLAAHFVVFETREGVTTKKLARYQQYRAANKIVERVVGGQLDRGLVWHTTGSGKSLTMVFAARKLMRAGLERPTVFIVIDRTDLDDQITGTFEACDFDGVTRAVSGEDLRGLIRSDRRGVIVTIINKFEAARDVVAERENVIVFVDEAHRSHEGEFGIWMRTALPNARLFAFTGTPVETTDRSTRRAFSPVLEEHPDGSVVFENYMDAYSIKQSIADGATVEVLYEPRLADWQIENADLDALFEEAFADLDEDQREALRRDAAREEVIAKAPARVEAIADDIYEVLRDKIAPAGFKAQLVAVDRAACTIYAEELSKYLQPDEYAVVMSRDPKRDGDALRRWWPAATWQRLNGVDPTPQSGEDTPEVEASHRLATRKIIERFKDPSDPLRLLIVNSMLLTGFDAPVEQGMFLDRPLRRHTLLQAIARTNRTYPEKEHGLVFDYWGVLADLDAALREFDPEDVAQAATSTAALAERFPEAIADALACVADLPASATPRRQMAWLVQRFTDDPDLAARFEDAFRAAQRIYETLAPDSRLAPHLDDYRQLVRLHAVWKHGSREDTFDIAPYRAKTHALVQDAIAATALQRDLPVFRIDGTYLQRLDEADLGGEEKAAEIEAAVVHEIKIRGEHDPLARSLSERLRILHQRRAAAKQLTLDLLHEYEQLASDYAVEAEAAQASGLSERAHALAVLGRAHAPDLDDHVLADVARRIDVRLGEVADFHGWHERPDVLRGVRKVMISELAQDERTRPLTTTGYIDEAVNALVARAER